MVGVEETHAVAVAQLGGGFDLDPVAADRRDMADFLAHETRCFEGLDAVLAAVDEIIGRAAVEGFFGLRREGEAAVPRRGAAVGRRFFEKGVEQRAVMRGDVLDVGQILEPAFDLERADAGFDQGAQIGALVVVLHRQQMLFMRDDAALRIGQGVGQTAGLRAFAAVGAASGMGMADVALAAVAYAQRAMDEEFERAIRCRGYFADLRQGHFARQDDLRKPDVLQKARLGRIADVGLGAGMQLDGRQFEFEQAHVLDDQGVGPGLVHLPGHAPRRLDLVVVQQGVERDEHPRPVTMRELDQPRDVFDAVAGVGAGAEGRAADIDRIGAVQDRLDAEVGILGGGEQFERMAVVGHDTGLAAAKR